MRLRITPDQARLGMSIEGLEDGWLSHPFWRERFVIRSLDDLERVRNGGTNLFIDTHRGTSPLKPASAQAALRSGPLKPARPTRSRSPDSNIAAAAPGKLPRRIAAPPAFDQADRKRASEVVRKSSKIITDVFDDCRRGHPVVMPQIVSVVRDIADALEHNSAAFSSVARLKEKDGYTYTHSIAVCALMITLARANNATRDEVHDFGIAGMLHDIGKLSIDSAILSKAGSLDNTELAEIRRHPEMGHRMLSDDPTVPPMALDVCLHHHERLDGTGYPFGLKGDQLTTAARIAVICDVYDAMTSNRPYKKGKSPIDAVTEMASLSDVIDQDLLSKFMRGIGVYPVGTLVRLRSNRLGVTMATTSASSRPAARAFYNIVDGHAAEYDDVILGDSFRDDQVVRMEEPKHRFGSDWISMKSKILAGQPLTPRSA